jgi:YfiH family protein
MLSSIPGILHGFSTRRAERNDFSLGPVSSPNPMIQINRVRFLGAIGAPGWPVLKLKQVHSGIVREMNDTMAAGDPVEGDAAITALHGALLGVQTADCVPILIADAQARCVAAIHAGWRGTAAGITERTVERLGEKFGVKPADLTASIGPYIGKCCFEVGEEVVDAIDDPDAFERRNDWLKPHVDLGLANLNQLLHSGLNSERIEVSSLCTRCRSDLFFSYRGEGDSTGRMLSVIGIAP